MNITGTILEANLGADMRPRLIISVNEKQRAFEAVDAYKDDTVLIKIDKPKKHRSLDANAYFWQLCDKIGKVIGVDKDTVYLWQLSKYGVFADVQAKAAGLQALHEHFRYTEVVDEDGELLLVRCYFGSSTYNTKEMSDLINGTVREAEELGIETLTPAEIAALISSIKGVKNDATMPQAF